MSAAQDAVPQKATPPKDTQHDDDETTQPQQQLADILAARRLLAALCIWKESPDSNSSHDATLQQLAQDIAGLLHDLHSHSANDEWTQVNNTQHLRAWYKQAQQEGKQEAKQIHSILVHMVFPKARIDKPLTMGWEFDLVQTWNSYATATHILKAYSDHEILAYCSVWLPYPFAQPHAVLRASLWDVNQEYGGWAVHIHSVPLADLQPDEAHTLDSYVCQTTQQRRREITVHNACVLLKQHSRENTQHSRKNMQHREDRKTGRENMAHAAQHQGVAVHRGSSSSCVSPVGPSIAPPSPTHQQSSPTHQQPSIHQEGGTMMEAVAHVDPQLPYVPPWLVKFVLTVMMPFVHGSMSKELARVFANPTSEHHKRNQQRGLYEQVRAAACL